MLQEVVYLSTLSEYLFCCFLPICLSGCLCLSVYLSVCVCLSVYLLYCCWPLCLAVPGGQTGSGSVQWPGYHTRTVHSSDRSPVIKSQVTCAGPYFFPNKKELLFQNQFTQQSLLETHLFQPILFVFALNNGGWFLLYQQFIYLFSPSRERMNSPISVTCHNNDIMALIVRLN